VNLKVLYRGALASCNYQCGYCPFAKIKDDRESLAADSAGLWRFVDWVSGQESADIQIEVLFTPWGEALIRSWYREAIHALSWMPHVKKVAIQTNLSYSTDWLSGCNKQCVALWTTYHPGETTRGRFLGQCRALVDLNIMFSVGMVGVKGYQDEIVNMRQELQDDIYLWINAYKDKPDYYTPEEIQFLKSVDPLFLYNLTDYESYGQQCRTGESVISVDSDGNVRRCHFIKNILGNIYAQPLESILQPRFCTRRACDCYIGYTHLYEPDFYGLMGAGVLERIPPEYYSTYHMDCE
jgi:MoaA/NifB/PqqE/SkfB family radical SAM enzyme